MKCEKIVGISKNSCTILGKSRHGAKRSLEVLKIVVASKGFL